MPRDSSTPRSASAKPPDDPRRPPRLKEITEAAERIARFVHRTPVLTCSEIDRRVGARLLFKCESFQKAGAFKIRGATNMVQQISAQHAERGVATHSSGNHAAALALAARQRAVPALIVMPRNAPRVKTAAVRDYGGEITFCEPTIEARHRALEQILEARGCCFVPPYDHPWIIAGQGTVGLELLAQAGPLEAIIAPVGGGGLLSGVSLAVRAISPRTQIFGAEPESADDAARSLEAGRLLDNAHPRTIADGLLAPLSELTFGILRRCSVEVLTVDDSEILGAMRLIWERMKIVVEPSAAVPLAALMRFRERFLSQRVGVVLSGGNLDLDRLPWQARGGPHPG